MWNLSKKLSKKLYIGSCISNPHDSKNSISFYLFFFNHSSTLFLSSVFAVGNIFVFSVKWNNVELVTSKATLFQWWGKLFATPVFDNGKHFRCSFMQDHKYIFFFPTWMKKCMWGMRNIWKLDCQSLFTFLFKRWDTSHSSKTDQCYCDFRV